jgi:hypothetical protein
MAEEAATPTAAGSSMGARAAALGASLRAQSSKAFEGLMRATSSLKRTGSAEKPAEGTLPEKAPSPDAKEQSTSTGSGSVSGLVRQQSQRLTQGAANLSRSLSKSISERLPSAAKLPGPIQRGLEYAKEDVTRATKLGLYSFEVRL